MNTLFVILLLVSLVGLVWGLIAPHHIATTAKIKRSVTRKHTGLIFGFFVLLFFTLTSVTAPPHPTSSAQDLPKVNLSEQKSSTSTPVNTVTTKQITETRSIAYTTQEQNDSDLTKGQTKVVQNGANGTRTLTYKITYTNGKQTDKSLISNVVTTQPTSESIEVGTYVAPTPQPMPVPAPAPAPKPSVTCYPLTNGGNCYEPGEYCRDSNHGASGLAGDGKSIICADNDGWRWEPN